MPCWGYQLRGAKGKKLGDCFVAFFVWRLCGAAGELPSFSPKRGLDLYTLG